MPAMHAWINKMLYTYKGILLSLEKEGNSDLLHHEIDQLQKANEVLFQLYEVEQSNSETENTMVVSSGWKEKKMQGYHLTGREFSVQGDEKTSGNGLW